MQLVPFEGYMIPGLHFENCSIWILHWEKNPTQFQPITEVWILWNNGQKECYISPKEAECILRKYHHFDKIIDADITITNNANGIEIIISVHKKNACTLKLKHKKSLKYKLINAILKIGNNNKIGEKGKTETGMYYHNIPKKIIPLLIDKAEFNAVKLSPIDNPTIDFFLGDGKPSNKPLINYCIHMLEE